MSEHEKSGARVVWALAVLFYVGVLVVAWSSGRAESDTHASQLSVWELEKIGPQARLVDGAVELGTWALFQAAIFVPLGFFMALAFPRNRGLLTGWFMTLLPAALLASLLAGTVLGFEPFRWEMPAMPAFIMAAAGCGFGAWMGLGASRGLVGLLLFVPKMMILALVLMGVGLAGLYMATATEPLDVGRPAVSSEHKRAFVRRLRENNPMRLKNGDTRELSMSAQDLELLFASGFSVASFVPRLDVRTEAGASTVRTSVRVPGLDRYLNLTVAVRGGVEQGALAFDVQRIRAGRLNMPSMVLWPVSVLSATTLRHDRAFSSVLAGVDSLRLDDSGMTVVYRRMDLRGEVLPAIMTRLGPDEATLVAARAQLEHLVLVAPTLAQAEDRFGAALESSFALAAERSVAADPVAENSGAILALANVLGHPQLRPFSGLESQRAQILTARRGLRRVELRGRTDWTKHFFVSAGLTQLSSVAVSDAAGLLKEELDADLEAGGSGFSFADLLADRAGTLFAREATRDARHARAMQERLSKGFQVDAFFPEAHDLPEGISDTDFRREYGGTRGAGYRRVVRDIEARLRSCSAYSQQF